MVVDGDTAYSYTNTTLVAVAMDTGRQRWSVPLPGAQDLISTPRGGDPNATQTPPPPPAVAHNAHGEPLIALAYPARAQAGGTARGHIETHVIAVGENGKTAWQATLPDVLPLDDSAVQNPLSSVIGDLHDGRGAAVVVEATATGNCGGYNSVNDCAALALDAGTGALWWEVKGMRPDAVVGDDVITEQSVQDSSTPLVGAVMAGLHGSDGTQAWRTQLGTIAQVLTVGTSSVLAVDSADQQSKTQIHLLDPTTGAATATLTPPDYSAGIMSRDPQCQYDDQATVVCWLDDNNAVQGSTQKPVNWIAGFASNDGHALWSITDQDQARTPPAKIDALFHGVLYTEVDNQGERAVELDARAGTDLAGQPTLGPTLVVPGWGLDSDEDSTTAYRATS